MAPFKTIGPDSVDGFMYVDGIRELTGAKSWIKQFELITMARTKKSAVEQFDAVGISMREKWLRIKDSYASASLVEAGLLREDDPCVLVYRDQIPGAAIVRASPGEPPRIVARWGKPTWPTHHCVLVIESKVEGSD
jgi:hypothetical protein